MQHHPRGREAAIEVLISTMPEAGHVHPVLPIAAALVARGHRVLWHTWPEWAPAVEGVGARFLPARHAPGLVELPPAPDPGATGIRASLSAQRNHLIERMIGQVADYEAIHDEHRVDVVVSDLCCLGAIAFSERREVPVATVGISPLSGSGAAWPPFGSGDPPPRTWADRAYNATYHRAARLVMSGLTRTYNARRAALGLPPVASWVEHHVSPQLHLQAGTPAIEFPCDPWPPQVRLVGPLLPPADTDRPRPPWWGRLAGARHVVHVTQGTVVEDPATLITPALAALEQLDGLVVVTTPRPERVATVPANAVLERFVPHDLLLPRCDVMVSNGGFNGAKAALAAGTPLVLAPWGNDQPDVAARMVRTGAAIDLGGRHPTPDALDAAVRAVLHDPTWRDAAARVATEFAGYDGGHPAAAQLEALVIGGA